MVAIIPDPLRANKPVDYNTEGGEARSVVILATVIDRLLKSSLPPGDG